MRDTYIYTQSREKRKKISMHLSIACGVLGLGSHGIVVAFRVVDCLNLGLHSSIPQQTECVDC
jgi:hypothetical protein